MQETARQGVVEVRRLTRLEEENAKLKPLERSRADWTSVRGTVKTALN
jgi:hypothetical protein